MNYFVAQLFVLPCVVALKMREGGAPRQIAQILEDQKFEGGIAVSFLTAIFDKDNSDVVNWLKFELACTTPLFYLDLKNARAATKEKGGVSLVSVMNHGLCYESDSVRELCSTRGGELRDFDARPIERFRADYNRTQWTVMTGHVCDKLGFVIPYASFSMGSNISKKSAKGVKQFQTAVRRDWYDHRYAWQKYVVGDVSWEEATTDAWGPKYISFPLTIYGLGPEPKIVTDSASDKKWLAETAGGLDRDFWCGKEGCGDAKGQKDLAVVDAIFCPMSASTALVRDAISSVDTRNTSDASEIQAAFYLMTTINGTWKIAEFGLQWVPRASMADIMLCKQFYSKENQVANNEFVR